MTGDLFTRNVPGEGAKLTSSAVRENFNALDNRTGALEVRAILDSSENPTTKLNVSAGVVYMRSGTSTDLGLIDFRGGIIDLSTASGFLNKKDENGNPDINKDNEGVPVSDTTGISPFPIARKRFFREVLIALKPNGRLTFIEGFESADGRSASYDIYYPDSYIPLSLVIVRNNGEIDSSGQIDGISQAKIRDVRPVVTTAFANGPQALISSNVDALNSRVSVLEESSEINSSTLAILPRVIPSTSVDIYPIMVRSIEIVPGNIYVNGTLFEFNGATITFATDTDRDGVTVPNGIFNCNPLDEELASEEYVNITSVIPDDLTDGRYNSVLVGLDDDGKIVCIHGTPAVVLPVLQKPSIPMNIYPICYVIYQGNNEIAGGGIFPIAYFNEEGVQDAVTGEYTTSGDPRTVPNGVINGHDISGSALLSASVGSAGSLVIQLEDTTNFFTNGKIRVLDNNTAPVDTVVTAAGSVALVPASTGVFGSNIGSGLNVPVEFGYDITSIFGSIGTIIAQVKIQDNVQSAVETSATVDTSTKLILTNVSTTTFDPTVEANKVRIINISASTLTLTLAKYVRDLDITNNARAINPDLSFKVIEDVRPFLLQLDLGSTFRKLESDPIDKGDGDVWYNTTSQLWKGYRDGYGDVEFDFTPIP